MKRSLITIVSLLAFVLLMLPARSQEQEIQEESFLLTFIPNIQFSPLYVAIANGYFQDIGLQISVEYLNEPDVVDLIASGQAKFGVVSGEQVILSVANGRPVVYVYDWFQQYPVGIIAPASVQSIADLRDLRVGVPGRFGASYTGMTTLFMSSGISPDDFTVEEIGFNAPEVLCIGGVDAAVVYLNNEPLQIENRIADGDCGDVGALQVIPVADVADLVSNGLLTSQDLVSENPELVAAVVAAFDKGLRDTIDNPAQAYLLSRDFVEGLPASEAFIIELEKIADEQEQFLSENPERDAIAASRDQMFTTLSESFSADELLQFGVLLESIKLWDTDMLGFSDLASWENMQETLLSMDFLDEAITVTEIFTNDFVPAALNEN